MTTNNNKPIIIVIDGPMGVGKTSLLKTDDKGRVIPLDKIATKQYVIREDTQSWTQVQLLNGTRVNMLDLDQVPSYIREMYVFLESTKALQKTYDQAVRECSSSNVIPLIFIDRGLNPAWRIFAKMDRDLKYINPLEEYMLKTAYETLSHHHQPDLIVYLKATYETSLKGVTRRALQSDNADTLRPEWVRQIWEYYQNFRLLDDNSSSNSNLVSINRDLFEDNLDGLRQEVSTQVETFILKQ